MIRSFSHILFSLLIICSFSYNCSAINSDTLNRVDPVNGRKIGYWVITGNMSKLEGIFAATITVPEKSPLPNKFTQSIRISKINTI